MRQQFVGVDLFAGAGGLSLGASMAGIDVNLAIEKDPHAAATYSYNYPKTKLVIDDIRNVEHIEAVSSDNNCTILFGGPPCQGFSTSNQCTRTIGNETNWLYKEFVRLSKMWEPDWIVFENVRGIFCCALEMNCQMIRHEQMVLLLKMV